MVHAVKICKTCNAEKTELDFDRNKDGKVVRNTCKQCRTERRNELGFRLGERGRSGRLKYHYGITQAQYDQMVVDQNGLCKVCSRPGINRWNNQLVVDHCHSTGKVRGLLCDKCNKGLGSFEDKIEVLEAAVQYLKDSK